MKQSDLQAWFELQSAKLKSYVDGCRPMVEALSTDPQATLCFQQMQIHVQDTLHWQHDLAAIAHRYCEETKEALIAAAIKNGVTVQGDAPASVVSKPGLEVLEGGKA